MSILPRRARRLALLPALAIAGIAAASADPEPDFPDGLSARNIYERVLDNRFETSKQSLVLISHDRGGNTERLHARMAWAQYAEGTGEHEKKISSRTILRYTEPDDLRGTGYLIINKIDAPNDQFVYFPSMRRVRRINLRGETIAGTDLSVEDIVPRELDDATYVRIPDAEVEGKPCFVIEATPRPEIESEYAKFLLVVEKEHYVPLRTRYWDSAGVEIKELRAEIDSIQQIEKVWLAMRSTMHQLIDGTHTELAVEDLEPNVELPARTFSQRELESGKIR
jgi:hypothetical protein